MKKTEICRKTADLGSFGTHTLIYYLTEGVFAAGITEYGVAVASSCGDECTVNAVTPDADEARRLIRAAAAGCVTPTSLLYVIQDWLEA